MMLFDAEGKIRRYESPEEILTEFFGMRLQYYERRRVALLQVRAPTPATAHAPSPPRPRAGRRACICGRFLCDADTQQRPCMEGLLAS
jgi:hypothetical protein